MVAEPRCRNEGPTMSASPKTTGLICSIVLIASAFIVGGLLFTQRATSAIVEGTAPAESATDLAETVGDVDSASERQLVGGGQTEPEAGGAVTPAELVASHGAGSIELEAPLLIEATSDVIIDAPGLDVTFTSDGSVASVEPGPGSIPLPSFGPLADAAATVFEGTVGYASGAEIAHLGAHTRADTNYWYVVLSEGTQLDTGLPFVDQLPVSFELPGAGSSVLVIDPVDPYLYISFPCPSSLGEASTRSDSDDRPDETGQATPANPPATISISNYPGGGCGVGFSGNGRIPFTASTTAGIPEAFETLEAELVIDGEFQVSTSTQVVGSAYVDIDADGFALAADGELSVAFALLPDKLDLSLPLGRGSIAYEYRGTHEDLWFAGTTGTSLLGGGSLDLVMDLAPAEGDLTISGRLRHQALPNGESTVTDESFLQLEGSASLGIDAIAELVGIEVEPFQEVAMFARIDHAGVSLQGTTAFSPLPGIAISGSASLDLMIPFTDLTESYLQIDGQFLVGGVDLDAGASLRIDRNGAVATGHLATPIGGVDLSGQIGPSGINLSGRIEVVVAVPDFGAYAQHLAREAGVQGTIDLLEERIDERINEIGRVDPARATVLRETIVGFRQERANVASIQTNIDINNGKITRVDGLLSQARRTWDNYTLGEQLLNSIPHGAYVTALNLEREGYKAANTIQRGYMVTANLTLTALEQTLTGIVGADEDLWRLESMTVELRVHAFSAEFLSMAAQAADDLLTTFGVSGTFSGTIDLTVGTNGIDGAFAVSHCDKDGTCTTLVGGTVTFPDFEACVTVAGMEACTKF